MRDTEVTFISLFKAINDAVDNDRNVYCCFPATEKAPFEFVNKKIELDFFKTGAILGNELCSFPLEEDDISLIIAESDEEYTNYWFDYKGLEGNIIIDCTKKKCA